MAQRKPRDMERQIGQRDSRSGGAHKIGDEADGKKPYKLPLHQFLLVFDD